MEDIEKRVKELEIKVSKLEDIISKNEIETTMEKKIGPSIKERMIKREKTLSMKNESKEIKDGKTKKSSSIFGKLKEETIGKYIIGGLASLLIFIAAISLVGLVWNSITPQGKLAILGSSGIILTLLGFVLIKKKKSPISSIILGTGAGLIFISIISANMLFGFIGKYTTFLLLGIWSISFILSYKYIKSFFAVIIAYIGSYAALLLALGSVNTSSDLIISGIFAVGIILTLLISANIWFNNKEKIIVHLFGIISLATIIIWGVFIRPFNYINETMWTPYIVGIVIILYLIMNRLYMINKNKRHQKWNIAIGIFVAILTALAITSLPNITGINGYIIFSIINLIQLIIVEAKMNKFKNKLTSIYAIFMAIGIVLISNNKFSLYMGASIPAFILLFVQKKRKDNDYNKTIKALIIFELLVNYLVSTVAYANKAIYILYAIPTLVLITLLLLYEKEMGDFKNLKATKILGFVTYLITTQTIGYHVIGGLKLSNGAILSNGGMSLLLLTLLFLGLTGVNYFKDWSVEDFKFIGGNEDNKNEPSLIIFYLAATIMFFYGINMIGYSNLWQGALIEILIVSTIAIMQSFNLIKSKEENQFAGFFIGIQFLILFWAIMINGFDLPFSSVIVSVVGLLIALASIIGGFTIRMKSLRLYGLILAILMALKFVIVDLAQENSIKRVIALLVGGLICFGISILYNKLNNIIDQS